MDWKKHVKAQARSGLSAAEYCRREDLSWSKFLYHRGKRQTQQPARFVPIGGQDGAKFKILVKEGITIEVPADFEASVLKRLMEVLSA